MDYQAYLDWMRSQGRDPGTFTGIDPSQWAQSAWGNGGQDAYRQNVSPYLGQEIDMRALTTGDPAGEGDSTQHFYEFRDPITGLWQRSAEWVDPDRTSYTFGHGGIAGETGASETSNGQHWLTPQMTVEQRDGKWYTKDGHFGVEKDQKNKETAAGLAAVLGGAFALNGGFGMFGGESAGGSGAFVGEGASSGIGGWDAALSGGAPNTAVMGAGGSGVGSSMYPGAGWAEMGAAESQLGNMILDVAPVGAGVTTGAGSGLLSTALKYAPGLLGALAGGKQGQGKGGRGGWDPRLDPYIFGDKDKKGAFGYAMGLLNSPVAPNAFSKFYGG
jgi:hypothetical protein